MERALREYLSDVEVYTARRREVPDHQNPLEAEDSEDHREVEAGRLEVEVEDPADHQEEEEEAGSRRRLRLIQHIKQYLSQ